MATPTMGEELTLLLICKTCKSVEEVPFDKSSPYVQGGKTQYDQRNNRFLNEAVYPHDQKGCVGMLADVDSFLWMSKKGRESTMEKLKSQLLDGGVSGGLADIQEDIYNIKATYSDDAANCYTLHNRPEGQCVDYKIENRKLKPKTDGDRKAAGLDAYKSTVYLCDYCPVKMFNQKKAFEAQGLYK